MPTGRPGLRRRPHRSANSAGCRAAPLVRLIISTWQKRGSPARSGGSRRPRRRRPHMARRSTRAAASHGAASARACHSFTARAMATEKRVVHIALPATAATGSARRRRARSGRATVPAGSRRSEAGGPPPGGQASRRQASGRRLRKGRYPFAKPCRAWRCRRSCQPVPQRSVRNGLNSDGRRRADGCRHPPAQRRRGRPPGRAIGWIEVHALPPSA